MLSNSFYEMAVKSKAGADYYGKMALGIMITILGVLAFPLIGGISFVISVIGIIVIFTFAQDRNLEYEYTFTEDSVEIAAVYNASKRKELFSFELNNVTMIVPGNSLRLEHVTFAKKRDYSSKRKDADKLLMVLELDDKKQLIVLEPNEKATEYIKNRAKHKMYNA